APAGDDPYCVGLRAAHLQPRDRAQDDQVQGSGGPREGQRPACHRREYSTLPGRRNDMARKRTTRNKKGQGNYWYDKKNKRHVWEIEHNGQRYKVADRDEAQARLRFEELKRKVLGGIDMEGSRQLLRTYLPKYIDTEVA